MKKWDYEITTTGARRTITAKSDRAKQRTPEPQEFANNADALVFVSAGVAEGFLFSCRGFVDHEYRNVRYNYFVKVNGSYSAAKTMDRLIRCLKSGMFILADPGMGSTSTSPMSSPARWRELMDVV